jgi:hypothetical protein
MCWPSGKGPRGGSGRCRRARERRGAAVGMGRGSREGNCAGRAGGNVGGCTTGWDQRLGTGRREAGISCGRAGVGPEAGVKRMRGRMQERTHGERKKVLTGFSLLHIF